MGKQGTEYIRLLKGKICQCKLIINYLGSGCLYAIEYIEFVENGERRIKDIYKGESLTFQEFKRVAL